MIECNQEQLEVQDLAMNASPSLIFIAAYRMQVDSQQFDTVLVRTTARHNQSRNKSVILLCLFVCHCLSMQDSFGSSVFPDAKFVRLFSLNCTDIVVKHNWSSYESVILLSFFVCHCLSVQGSFGSSVFPDPKFVRLISLNCKFCCIKFKYLPLQQCISSHLTFKHELFVTSDSRPLLVHSKT